MSTSYNLENGINDNFVIPDAVPDPPRFPSNPIIDISEEIKQFNNPQNDRLNENEIPHTPSDDSSHAYSADNNEAKDSKASNTDTQNNAKHTYKPKKSPKSRKSAAATISFNIVNSKHVKVGPTVKNVFNVSNIQHHNSNSNHKCDFDPKETNSTREMSSHIKALSDSKLQITKEDMLLVKTHMGHGWKQVAKQIGYSKGQIEQFIENYKHSDEIIYQILLDWKQSCTKSATIGRLITEMWSSKEYECTEILAAAHTST